MTLINKFLLIVLGLFSILIGFKIVYTKKLGQGNAGMGRFEVYIGDMAYIVGGVFIVLGFLTLYVILKNKG